LALAERLQSQHWIHKASQELAVAHCLLGDLAQARTVLDRVLSAGMAMDTLHKRGCWARRAELALLERDPVLALDIVDRLIASVPRTASQGVITYLWQLKADALSAVGQTGEAEGLLRAAIAHARIPTERALRWRLHASLGRLYGATGDQERAEGEYATARQLVQQLAETVPDRRLQEGFVRRAGDVLASRP
jgi:hypothetical protein